MEKLYARIQDINNRYPNRDISLKVLKLQEELGEVAVEVLRLKKCKKTTDSKEEVKAKIFEETVDCILVLLDICGEMDMDINKIVQMGNKKCDKWETSIAENHVKFN